MQCKQFSSKGRAQYGSDKVDGVSSVVERLTRNNERAIDLIYAISSISGSTEAISYVPLSRNTPLLNIGLRTGRRDAINIIICPHINDFIIINFVTSNDTNIILLASSVRDIRIIVDSGAATTILSRGNIHVGINSGIDTNVDASNVIYGLTNRTRSRFADTRLGGGNVIFGNNALHKLIGVRRLRSGLGRLGRCIRGLGSTADAKVGSINTKATTDNPANTNTFSTTVSSTSVGFGSVRGGGIER